MKKEFVTKNFVIQLFFSSVIFVISLLILFSCAFKQKSPDKVPLDVKIGQMLNVGFRGLSADTASAVAKQIKNNHIGGVVLFDYDVPADSSRRNIQSPGQLKRLTQQLQKYADISLLIAIDQEGGRVSRLKEKFGFPSTVSVQYLGSLNNIDSTRYYAQEAARVLKKAGINLNLAPVLDLNINPNNPVIGSLERSFAAEPAVVVEHARAYIEALHAQDILTTLKHFPGHGSSKNDSHKGIVDVTDTWQRKELQPYEKLIKSGYDDVIMTAHIYNARWDSIYPATLSRPVITGILRDSLGYSGVVMSDDLQMGAIRKHYKLKKTIRLAIHAGVDILVFANNSVFDSNIAARAQRIITELIAEGEISEKRITESYERIMELKQRL